MHNTTAEDFLTNDQRQGSVRTTNAPFSLIYLDPARRDSHGGKVFRLEDCTPNVVTLLPTVLQHLAPEGRLMLKLSPMLDITQAVNTLVANHSPQGAPLAFDVHVVAVKNEVKEVLLLGERRKDEGTNVVITAIDLAESDKAFVFTRQEEHEADCQMVNGKLGNVKWLYEPNAAILKAGAYKLIAQRFSLTKLDVNTHLYVSNQLIANFPGRVWAIKGEGTKGLKGEEAKGSPANVVCRNYPLTAEQLKKKLHLRDGGAAYVIGCRVNGKPTLFLCERADYTNSPNAH